MERIYTVVENGDAYPLAYSTYKQAVNAVKSKHKETLDEEERWSKLPENQGEISCNEIDVPEAKEGLTRLYIEKGIHIEIHRLPVITQATYTLEDLFTVVARCSFHLTEKQRNQLFQQMCTELEERYSVEHSLLKEAMKIPDLELEEHCTECNTPLPEEEEGLCSSCKTEKNKN